MNDDSVAFRTLHLRLLRTFFLLTSVFGAAAVIDFLADEFEAGLVASRHGIAGDQRLGRATARVNALSDEVFARFADVGMVICARFVDKLGAAAFVHFLFSIDGLGNGASWLLFALFLHASRHHRFALLAVDLLAFHAFVLVAFRAVGFLWSADPLLASAFEFLLGQHWLLAFVAIQLLFDLLFGFAIIDQRAFVDRARVCLVVLLPDCRHRGERGSMTLVAFRDRIFRANWW